MKSTLDNPLAFFDWYLDAEIYNNRRELYIDVTENLHYGVEDIISQDNDDIVVKNVYHQDEIPSDTLVVRMSLFYGKKLKPEIQLSKQLIEQNLSNRYADKKELQGYAQFLKIKIELLKEKKSYKDFKMAAEIVDDFENMISKYAKVTPSYSFIPSFNLLASKGEEQESKVKRLYELMTKGTPLIHCEEDEFISAFTGKEVTTGLNWLVLGKNKFTSKTSLFYFLGELLSKNHLDGGIANDLNKYVRYVFRDINGKEFKNLKQSKSNTVYSNKTAQKEQIDKIISLL